MKTQILNNQNWMLLFIGITFLGTTQTLQAQIHANPTTILSHTGSAGNIGIGTSSLINSAPLHKLHLHNGAMMISGSNNMGGPMIVFSDNVTSNAYPNGRWGIEYDPSSGGLNFWQPANPAFGNHVNYNLFLKNNGNIGIGLSNPSAKLQVNGGIRLNDRGQKISFLSDDVYIERPLLTDGLMMNAPDIYIRSTLTPINMMSASTIMMNDTFGVTTMLVNPWTRKVGIGTNAPTSKFDVVPSGEVGIVVRGNSSAFVGSDLGINRTSTSTNAGQGCTLTLNDQSDISNSNMIQVGLGNMQFLNNSTGTWVERMRIAKSGNIGIGTTAPNEKLSVHGSMSVSGNVGIGRLPISNTSLSIQSNTGNTTLNNAYGTMEFYGLNKGDISWDGGNDATIGINHIGLPTGGTWFQYNHTPLLAIHNNGRVGIGTTNPKGLLEIKNSVNNQAGIVLSGKEYYINNWSVGNNNGIALINGVNRNNNKQLWIADADSLDTKNNTNGVLSFHPTTSASYISSHATDGITPLKLLLNVNGGNVGIGTINPIAKMHVDGSVYIGSATHTMPSCPSPYSYTPAGYKLYVEGGILTEKLKVAVKSSCKWADYVFANDYQLKPLEEVEDFINKNKHLPGVPSATELVNEGLDIAEMQAKQMEKIEELTLHMIAMKKENESLKKEVSALKKSFTQFKK